MAQQSYARTRDLTGLLLIAGTAMRSITHLNLNASAYRSRIDSEDECVFQHIPSPDHTTHVAPPKLQTVLPEVFLLLAAALPILQHIVLSTSSCSVDLAAFGSQCPKLSSLHLGEPNQETLDGIKVAVPCLTHLHVSGGFSARSMNTKVCEYIEGICHAVHGCTRITSLELDFRHPHTFDEVVCPSAVWDQLPASIVEWSCLLVIPRMLEAESFMSRVRVLSLWKLPKSFKHQVQKLLKLAPLLEKLSLSETYALPTVELMWKEDITAVELSVIKNHLLDGFQLSCNEVVLSGPGRSVRDLLTWQSPLKDTTACDIRLHGDEHPLDCFDQLARVLPNILELCIEVRSSTDWEDAPLMVTECVASVMGCKHLEKLEINLPVAFTDSDLVALCMSLPDLSRLSCRPCHGLSLKCVDIRLRDQGREIDLGESRA